MSEINRTFSPEFRNRLDGIIWFKHLTQDIILQIVDKFVCDLQVQLDKKQVSMELSSTARKWLAEQGYDQAMGARPMARVIQEQLKKPLANEILFGRLIHGGDVRVDLVDNTLNFEYQSEREVELTD